MIEGAGDRYEFQFGEPGLYVEMYLPLKTAHKADLDQILKAGLNWDEVTDHLRHNRPSILDFWRESHPQLSKYDDGTIDRLERVYYGYSIYDVDGMFGGKDGTPETEASTVLRMIFRPPLEKLTETHGLTRTQANFISRRYLRFWTYDVEEYLFECKAWKLIYQKSIPAHRRWALEKKRTFEGVGFSRLERFIRGIDKWHNDVRLFFNGYVAFKVSARILELKEQGVLKKAEDEIWITTFKDLAVMRLLYRPGV